MSSPIFLPKSLTVFAGYTGKQFARDVVAGLTVGCVALPLALALGIGSIPPDVASRAGLSPPVVGLVTAIIAGFIISALGGTRASIGGPTAAFVVIVATIASKHGYEGLAVATIMSGIILIALGLTRMGGLIKYIPYPVTMGFTAGIGVTIFTGQIKDFFGLKAIAAGEPPIPPEFLGKIRWYWSHAGTIDWTTAGVALVSAAAIYAWPKFVTRRVPGPIVVLLGATAATHALGLPLETIGSRFGTLPTGLPMPRWPEFEWSRLGELVGPAFTIALLGAIESLLCAVVADGMLGTKHRSNTELIAQGAANIAAPLFGGIPATGAIARTATNIQSGGRTPMAGMIHAGTLLAIMLLIGRWASLVPLCVLSSVLMVVAWNMMELRRLRWLMSGPRGDALVLVTTFGLTVLTDLTVAVQAGMLLACILFIKRMADVSNVGDLQEELADSPADGVASSSRGLRKVPGVEIYTIRGTFFFGAAYKLRDTLDAVGQRPKVLIIDLKQVLAMDATGMHALDELRRRCRRDGTAVFLVGVHSQPLMALAQSGLLDAFGDQNLFDNVPAALDEAEKIAASADLIRQRLPASLHDTKG